MILQSIYKRNVGLIAGNFGPVHKGHTDLLSTIVFKFQLSFLLINLQNKLESSHSRHGVNFNHSESILIKWADHIKLTQPNFEILIFGGAEISRHNHCQLCMILTNAQINALYIFDRGIETREQLRHKQNFGFFQSDFQFDYYRFHCSSAEDTLGLKTFIVVFIRKSDLSSTSFVRDLLKNNDCSKYVPDFLSYESDKFIQGVKIFNLKIYQNPNLMFSPTDQHILQLQFTMQLNKIQIELIDNFMWKNDIKVFPNVF